MSIQPEGNTDRRSELLATAADIFRDKGYHATSMSDIAGAMGIRKASLYHHIISKDALLHELSVTSMRHIIEALESVDEPDAEERLCCIIVRHLEAMLGDRSYHATALVELRSLAPSQRAEVVQLRKRYEDLIDAALLEVRNARDRWPGVDIRLVRMALLGMLNWTVFWFDPNGPETAEGIARNFCRIFLPA